MWTLICHYQIRSTGRGLTTKQALKEWLHTLVPEYNIHNFNTDWNDGRPLCGLVDRLQPGLCPNHLSLNPNDGLQNCKLGMELAEKHFDVPMILDPEDLNNPDVDDLSVMTYISYFFTPAMEQLLNWIRQKIPGKKINNLSTDWNDGINLAALLDSCHPGLCPDKDQMDPHNALDNLEKCVKLAQTRLNIICPVAPKTLSDPKVDEIVVATYLSRFKYAKVLASADDLVASKPKYPYGAAVVRKPVEFQLELGDNPELALGHLKMTVTGPHAQAVVEIDKPEQGKAVARFIPTESGKFLVSGTLNDENISGCPFEIPVVDPDKWKFKNGPPEFLQVNKPVDLEVEGDAHGGLPQISCEILNDKDSQKPDKKDSTNDNNGTPKNNRHSSAEESDEGDDKGKYSLTGLDSETVGTVGEPFHFNLDIGDTDDSEDEKPVFEIEGPSKAFTPETEEHTDNNYTVSFTPEEVGPHQIVVSLGGEQTSGSPYTITVINPEPEIEESVDTCSEAEMNDEADFVDVDVFRLEPGKYNISLTPTDIGKVEGQVTIGGKHVNQSPFKVLVCDTAKCYVSGLENDVRRTGEPISFVVHTKDAGEDIPHVDPQGPTTKYKPNIVEDNKDKYTVTFTPTENGKHEVPVFFGGEHVDGSPFTIEVGDSVDSGIISNIPEYLQVETPCSLDIIGAARSPEEFKCSITDLDGETTDILDTTLSKNEDTPNQFVLLLQPKDKLGTATVEVKLGGTNIENSPFTVNICDASKCRVSGLEDKNVHNIGNPMSFTVDSSQAGDAKPFVKTRSPKSQSIVDGTDNGDGTHTFTFRPSEVGSLKVIILFGEQSIPGSPFHINVQDVNICSARGPGLSRAIANQPAKFIITTSSRGLLEKEGGLEVDIVSKNGRTTVDPRIEDLQDNTYGVTYIAPHEGDFFITIKVNDNPIPGSDFKVIVHPSANASKCRAYGPSLHPNALLISGRPLELYVDTKKAGTGELQVAAQGPKKTTPKVFMAEEDSTYSLRIDAEKPGWYRIHVWWSQVHIPKSPFDIKVHQGPDASKVRAYGPGLGPQIEVHKPAEFLILTRDAGIGTLTVIVNGVKDAFRVEVRPEDSGDPRTLKGVYYPREGGDYKVIIKWSGKEIPGSPFPVTVTDPVLEAHQLREAQMQQQRLQKKRVTVMNPGKFALVSNVSPGLGSLMPNQGRIVTNQTKKVVRKRQKHRRVVTNAVKSTPSIGQHTRNTSAPTPLSIEGKRGLLKNNARKRTQSIEAAMQKNADMLGDHTPIGGSLKGGAPKTWGMHTVSTEPVLMPTTKPMQEYQDEFPPTVIEESPTPIHHTYSFDHGDIPDERPISFSPVYVATGDNIPLFYNDTKKLKKKRSTKKK